MISSLLLLPLLDLLLPSRSFHVRVDGDDLPAAEDSKVVPVVARLADGRPLVPLRVREGRAERQGHSKELQRVGSAMDLKICKERGLMNPIWSI